MKLFLAISQIGKQAVFLYKKLWLFRLVVLVIFGLAIIISLHTIFFGTKKISFAYVDGQACARAIVVLPNLQKSKAQSYVLNKEKLIKIMGYPVIATKLCYKLQKTPIELTKTKTNISFLGVNFLSRNIEINTPEYPKIDNSLQSKPFIAVAEPLVINLNQPDNTFDYSINANGSQNVCKKRTLKTLECNVESLKLKHATSYQFKITRQFKGKGVEVLAKVDLPTITPIKVLDSSIQNNQTRYDKPKEIVLAVDKNVRLIDDAKLTASIEGQEKLIKTDIKFNKRTIIISIKEDLPRGTYYNFNIKDIHAVDGESLADGYNLKFYTSKRPSCERNKH
jgi:methionine-rich copper-binding protein CopC